MASAQQLKILKSLDELGGMTTGTIAKHTQIEPATVAVQLNRLKKMGLAVIEGNEWCITKEGIEVIGLPTRITKEPEELSKLTKQDLEAIADLKEKEVEKRLMRMLAPHIANIREIEDAKRACLLSIFSAPSLRIWGQRIRSFSHSLLVGPLGVAKTELLMFCNRITPRSMYATGKGISGAGLTAGWIYGYLQPGLLPLCDGGLACIDEMDKVDLGEIGSLHSVPSYSPIIIRFGSNLNSIVDILPIDDLFYFAEGNCYRVGSVDVKELSQELYVYGGANARPSFVRVHQVTRHPYDGPITRINTMGGLVDTTPNHQVVFSGSPKMAEGGSVKEGDILSVGLLDRVQRKRGLFIGSKDLAWLYGLFLAEGGVQGKRRRNDMATISNKDLDLLEKAKQIYEENSHHRASIVGPDEEGVYRLCFFGERVKDHFESMFYTSSRKKVPRSVLNAPSDVKRAFLDGFYIGDGCKRGWGFSTDSLLLSLGITYLKHSLDRNTFNVYVEENMPSRIHIFENKKSEKPRGFVRRVVTIPYRGFVYDLATESQKFSCGVGPIRVKNSAMELGEVYYTKGPAKEKLNARCRIIGAGNPRDLMYEGKPRADMINIDQGLLSRFDVVLWLKEPKGESWQEIGRHYVRGLKQDSEGYEVDLTRKYIQRSWEDPSYEFPRRLPEVMSYTAEMLSGVRSWYPKTPRVMLALLRLGIAKAKLRLDNQVTEDDLYDSLELIKRTMAVEERKEQRERGFLAKLFRW